MSQFDHLSTWDDVAAWLRGRREAAGSPSYTDLAAEAFTASGALATELGHTLELARHHEGTASLAQVRGDLPEAAEHLRASAEHYDAARSPEAERVRNLLATLTD